MTNTLEYKRIEFIIKIKLKVMSMKEKMMRILLLIDLAIIFQGEDSRHK